MATVKYPLFGPPQLRLKKRSDRIMSAEDLQNFDGGDDGVGGRRQVYTAILGMWCLATTMI